jgi:hypothetical protein
MNGNHGFMALSAISGLGSGVLNLENRVRIPVALLRGKVGSIPALRRYAPLDLACSIQGFAMVGEVPVLPCPPEAGETLRRSRSWVRLPNGARQMTTLVVLTEPINGRKTTLPDATVRARRMASSFLTEPRSCRLMVDLILGKDDVRVRFSAGALNPGVPHRGESRHSW